MFSEDNTRFLNDSVTLFASMKYSVFRFYRPVYSTMQGHPVFTGNKYFAASTPLLAYFRELSSEPAPLRTTILPVNLIVKIILLTPRVALDKISRLVLAVRGNLLGRLFG